MNKTEQRFEAAKAAMQGVLSDPTVNRIPFSDVHPLAVRHADALLAELARTCKESLQVEPEWTQWKGVGKSVQAHGHPFIIICKNEVEASLAATYHNAEMKRVTGTEGKS
jgi:hypothetical protein